MSKFASVFGGNAVLVGGAAVVGAVFLAVIASGMFRDPQAPEPPAVQTSAPAETASDQAGTRDVAATPVAEGTDTAPKPEPENQTNTEETAASEQETAPEQPSAPAAILPSFDVVRIDADGNTVVAGQAAPNAQVAILLDAAEIAQVEADSAGKFASLLFIAPSSQPRVLTLVARGPEGDVFSDASFIIAPNLAAAVAVAEATQKAASQETAPATSGEQTAPAPETGTAQPAEAAASTADTDEPAATARALARVDSPSDIAQTDEQPDAAAAQAGSVAIADATNGTVAEIETVTSSVSETTTRSAPNTQSASADPTDSSEPSTETAAAQAGTPQQQPAAAETQPTPATPVQTAAAETAAAESDPAPASQTSDPAASPESTQTEGSEATAQAKPTAQPVQETTQDSAQEPAQQPVKKAPAVLVSDAEGVRVVQPAAPADTAPEVLSTVAIDAISYSDTGDVELAGRGRRDSFVRVYLDNRPITSSRITDKGMWTAQLPDVDTGVYRLRVDEVDEAGKVTSRVGTPFKREAPAKVAQAKSAQQEGRAAPVRVVTVQPGFTLWAIARENYGEGLLYVRVYEANKDKIRDPDLIYPGQVFSVPE